jgi:hypothetical protein
MSESARTSNVRRNQAATTTVALATTDDAGQARAIVVGTILDILGQQGVGHILASLRIRGVMDAYRKWSAEQDAQDPACDLVQDETVIL